jgi:glycosyltransferase involved in cell wall biosynthesis
MLAQALSARGSNVTWWTSRFDHFGKTNFAGADGLEVLDNVRLRFLEGMPYTRNVSISRLINHWQIARHFRRLWRSEARPDLVLCSFPTIELSAEAVKISSELGVPVVLDVRDLWPDILVERAPQGTRWLASRLLSAYSRMARRALRAAPALIAVSAGYLDWALTCAGRARTPFDLVVPLAYSLPERETPTREEARRGLASLGVNPEGTLCIFSGTFGQTYDLKPVIDAAAALSETQARFSFLICGDGERASEWRRQATGRPNVVFTGWLDQARLRAALLASDIGLAAYAWGAPQGIPNKVIEYLASGLPVVSSLEGECAELLKETNSGITYDPRNAQSLLNSLLALADSGRRADLSINARATFAQRFRAETVYTELASRLERWARGPDSLAARSTC